jgi:hypothetical protein
MDLQIYNTLILLGPPNAIDTLKETIRSSDSSGRSALVDFNTILPEPSLKPPFETWDILERAKILIKERAEKERRSLESYWRLAHWGTEENAVAGRSPFPDELTFITIGSTPYAWLLALSHQFPMVQIRVTAADHGRRYKSIFFLPEDCGSVPRNVTLNAADGDDTCAPDMFWTMPVLTDCY